VCVCVRACVCVRLCLCIGVGVCARFLIVTESGQETTSFFSFFELTTVELSLKAAAEGRRVAYQMEERGPVAFT